MQLKFQSKQGFTKRCCLASSCGFKYRNRIAFTAGHKELKKCYVKPRCHMEPDFSYLRQK